MVFSSFTFIFLFLPAFLLAYFSLPWRLKNLCALFFSYLFYSWGAPSIVVLLVLGSTVDYYLSKGLHGKYRDRLLFIGIALNLLALGYFKYTNFFFDQINAGLGVIGLSPFTWVKVALPAGISFFTFQKISYLLDVYRGRTTAAGTLLDYMLYVAFFPQLIAGPILRYHDVYKQLTERQHSSSLFVSGFCRFSIGLGKKVLIADAVGRSADQVFSLIAAGEVINPVYAWIGIIAYALQIYFDFSGYSDMAIGLARMIGFRFLENFDRPYISQTITEFWRRWHISLSNFMKEYLYIPLGGNQLGTSRTYLNLLIVFLLSGLWHGANWTFVIWGLYHGLFLIVDRLGWLSVSQRLPKALNILITFIIVLVGWVFFRAENIAAAFDYIGLLCDPAGYSIVSNIYPALVINNREYFFFVLGLVIVFLPAWSGLMLRFSRLWSELNQTVQTAVYAIYALFIFTFSVITISGSRFSPFLYFEF